MVKAIYESSMIPEDNPSDIIEKDFRKQARFMKRCKETVWSRWRRKYLLAYVKDTK